MKLIGLKTLSTVLLGATLSLQVISASAASVANITTITGTWGPVTGGSNLTGVGTDSISWGGSSGTPSGYDFDASATPINGILPDGAAFDLGDFTHRNQPIPAGTSITEAQLNLTVAGTITNGGSSSFSVNSTFNFSHDETTNQSPCGAGSVSVCDDVVTTTFSSLGSTSVLIDGVDYFFDITGFFIGDETFTQFLTEEGKSNTAELRGVLTSTPREVPIPAAAWLFGSGLIALAGIKRRKS